MGTIEQKILSEINTYGIWMIILLILLIIFASGIYSLLKKIIKNQKTLIINQEKLIEQENRQIRLQEQIANIMYRKEKKEEQQK